MQKYSNSKVYFSPTDLVVFLNCNHATYLDVKSLDEDLEKTEASATVKLLREKGLEHENSYLQQLKDEGKNVVEISKKGSLRKRIEQTNTAINSEADVIYQAVFLDSSFRGDADFLIKCDTPSQLGNYSYEVLDTKLARTGRPKHIVQLCVYSELLESIQGIRPKNMHLYLGNQELHTFKVSDFFYYYSKVKERFSKFLNNLPKDTYPEPCSHCKFCKWKDRCDSQWEQDDYLCKVANIQRSQINKLKKSGIFSVAKLSTTSPDKEIPKLNPTLFKRLRAQATLQTYKAATGKDKYEIIQSRVDRGFSRMPMPDEGDLFFDMESDPFFENGLEYLFGVYYCENGKYHFKPFWAHNHKEEKTAFIQFMNFLEAQLAKYPTANIYHYNHYETTALKRLAGQYALCEELLDNLLREQKFIDLYLIIKEGIRTSEPGYSIKNLETFYMNSRTDDISTATDSMVIYNEWRATGKKELLLEIEKYNKTDCISTKLLRDWLVSIKPKNIPFLIEQSDHVAKKQRTPREWEQEYEKYRMLINKSKSKDLLPIKEIVSHLLEYHNREAKPEWWSIFERQSKFEDEIIDDPECLGGLRLIEQPYSEEQSLIYTYAFTPQEYKIREGDRVINVKTLERTGTVIEIQENPFLISIKRRAMDERLPTNLSIGPSGPIDNKILRSAIYRYASRVLAITSRFDVATELLQQNLPRISGVKTGDEIIQSNNVERETLKAIKNLNSSYLFVQGPPGSGKTYTISKIIVELLNQDYKIAVAANSHKAIHTLLEKIENVAIEKEVKFLGIKKSTKDKKQTEFYGSNFTSETRTENIRLSANLVAGTAWTFSNPHFGNNFDYLFIDEAGQVPTANVIAMSAATKNIILVGDQMQLSQPVKGIHPGQAGLSVLELLLKNHPTIPPEKGVFSGKNLENAFKYLRICFRCFL